ncbi:MAG TPA: hypothetical protein VGE43_03355 [Acidimicrobiales bacterium]
MTVVEPEVASESATPVDPALISEEIGNTGVLKRKSKVRAFTALPGVPEGTPGKVALVNGWDEWIRYHVMFDNGVSIGSLNREHLVPAKQYDEMAAKRHQALESGVFDRAAVADTAAEGGEVAALSAEAPVVNGVSIPPHLIERAAAARQRLGA